MSDAVIDDLVALLPPLLQSLEGLGFVARYFHPPDFEEVMRAVGAPDAALAEVLPRLQSWPDTAAHIREPLQAAGEGLVSAFAELRKAPHEADGVRTVYRALRHGPRAQEALYPLARGLPPLSSFFLRCSRWRSSSESTGSSSSSNCCAAGGSVRAARSISSAESKKEPDTLASSCAGFASGCIHD